MNRGRVKVCHICEGHAGACRFEAHRLDVDYKNDRLLRRFVTERGQKLFPGA